MNVTDVSNARVGGEQLSHNVIRAAISNGDVEKILTDLLSTSKNNDAALANVEYLIGCLDKYSENSISTKQDYDNFSKLLTSMSRLQNTNLNMNQEVSSVLSNMGSNVSVSAAIKQGKMTPKEKENVTAMKEHFNTSNTKSSYAKLYGNFAANDRNSLPDAPQQGQGRGF